MRVGERVVTPRGAGVVTAITLEERWVFGKLERASLVVVKLDASPHRAVRPVFYASQVQPEAVEKAAP